MNYARWLGVATAVAVFVVDQASKVAVVRGFSAPGDAPTPLAPFLNLTLRLNPGISFSFFPQTTAVGVAVLLAFTIGAIALLGFWLWRTEDRIVGVGIGAILGGALGNAADRLTYGAVVDFLDLHLLDRHFFVFNVGDAAINVGVAVLLLHSMIERRSPDGDRKG